MTTKEIARTLTTISEEQWEAILTSSKHVTTLPFVQELSNFDSSLKKETTKVSPMDEMEIKVRNVLRRIGVPPHILGYKYLQDALILAYVDESCILHGKITTVLYPLVAKRNDTTVSKVERAIRHAIEIVYKDGNPDVYGEVFKTTKTTPTNAYAISALHEYVKVYE